MARRPRIVVPGVPVHVVQRGNHCEDVFFSDLDRRIFLKLLEKHSQRYGLRIQGYCLMTNHYHVICEPARENSLAYTFRLTNAEYSRWIQVQRGQSGQLWQGRYRSCILDEPHFRYALCYVEQNPVRAGMVQLALDWPWSSAAAHVGERPTPISLDMSAWQRTHSPRGWAEVLRLGITDAAFAERFRQANQTGRPIGSVEFLQRMEVCLGRPLGPQKRGPKVRALIGD
ncbi:MAG: transposase [Bryobacteraceae bacterium]|jgi:putative transposase